nr:hypothetical protein [Brucella anthropi]
MSEPVERNEPAPFWYELGLATSATQEVSPESWIGYERAVLEFRSERSPFATVEFPANEGRFIVTVTHTLFLLCTENSQFLFAVHKIDRPVEVRPNFTLSLKVKNIIPVQSIANPITIGTN